LCVLRVTDYTNKNLTNDDTNDLEVSDGVSPLLVADLVGLPARRPDSSEKWRQVTDGEKNVSGRTLAAAGRRPIGGSHTLQDPDLRQAGRRS
jgi:hypothetical protein